MALADAVPYAVAAWPLNEASGTRADQVGSNDLTDNNTVGSGTGKVNGTCADFERDASEYLSKTDTDNSLDLGDTDWMARLWVKLESTASVLDILSKWDGSNGYLLLYNSGTSRFEWYCRINGSTGVVSANNFGAPSPGVWYLLHVWHDATNNQIGIAVNAGTANTTSHSIGVGAHAANFQLGQRGGGQYYDGLMDDVVLLAGYILSPAERTEDYNSGTGVAFADWDASASSVSSKSLQSIENAEIFNSPNIASVSLHRIEQGIVG